MRYTVSVPPTGAGSCWHSCVGSSPPTLRERCEVALADAGELELVPALSSIQKRSTEGGSAHYLLPEAGEMPNCSKVSEKVGCTSACYNSTSWRRVRLIDYAYWVLLSGGSRRPTDVLSTLQAGKLPKWLTKLGASWRFDFAAQLAAAEVVDDLIVMTTPHLGQLVLLEGHSRLPPSSWVDYNDPSRSAPTSGCRPRSSSGAVSDCPPSSTLLALTAFFEVDE
jgi:hypothetical protein